MQEIICYTTYLPLGKEQNISFLELLLDENWANGEIVFPEKIYGNIGDFNHKLVAKQKYEFLLRAVQKYPLKAVGISNSDNCTFSSSSSSLWDDYCTDCYIIGKYQQELLASGYFKSAIQTLTESILRLPDHDAALVFLDKMLSHSPEYYAIDDDTQPILLLRSPNTCYGILQFFIDRLAEALISCHQRVIVINDDNEDNFVSLIPYIGHHYKAIIGIQTYAFSDISFDAPTTSNLSNLIHCPKFNIILDHPITVKNYAEHGCNDYYFLLHDRNYLSFSKQYYHKIKNCFYFPPAGMLPSHTLLTQKKYDVTFIGSFHNYREILHAIYTLERPLRFLSARLIHLLRHEPNLPAEIAFQKVLNYYNIQLSEAAFLKLFYQLRSIFQCVMYYYREKIIQTLLNAQIQIHVYSDSWKNAPFSEHPCLIRHHDISIENSLTVMQQSKISLNIMSWHKDGLTERILNGMLCHSAILSNKSTRLEEEFIDGEDILLFNLSQIEKLPRQNHSHTA